MDDGVGDVRVLRHQPVLDDVREAVGLEERRVAAEPDVQIEKRMIRRAARADVMAALDLGHAHDDAADVVFAHHDAVREDA